MISLKFDKISNEICNLIRANDDLESLNAKILAGFDMFFQKLDLKTNLNSLAKICAKEFENGVEDIFLKQKNELFKKWAKENNYKINPEKDTPELIVKVSDADKTTIAQEHGGEMKILNN